KGALEHYQQALKLGSPDEIAVRLGMIACYEALDQAEREAAEIDALSQRPDLGDHEGEVLYWKARINVFRGREHGDPDTLLRKALARGLSPALAEVVNALLAETMPEAIDHARKAAQIDPHNQHAYEQLLIFLFMAGRRDEARLVLARLHLIRPR